MKQIIVLVALGLLTVFLMASGSAQTPDNKNEQALVALIKEIQAQQAQIADNQTKIDGKLAETTEAVRVARIFAGRGGK